MARKRLTKRKARRIGKRRIVGNKGTPKQWSTSRKNGKRAMRIARRRSANRRKKYKGNVYSNFEYTVQDNISYWLEMSLLFTALVVLFFIQLIITGYDYEMAPILIFFIVMASRSFMKYKRCIYSEEGILTKKFKIITNLLNFMSSAIVTYAAWGYLLDLNNLRYDFYIINNMIIAKSSIYMFLSAILSLISTIIHSENYFEYEEQEDNKDDLEETKLNNSEFEI